ncbi:MAG: aminotransferase class I/II-fold pyridoxal phosphate-dependent enzyme [Lentisphaerota bacterium]
MVKHRPGIDSDQFTQADFFDADHPDLFEKTALFSAYLADWKKKGGYTYHRCVDHAVDMVVDIARLPGEIVSTISFASNNYLGLNQRAEVIEAACKAAHELGTGLCGSRFLSGTHKYVVALERELAAFEGQEDCAVFTTGYQANVGVISALLRPSDTVFVDRLAHASIMDGCRLAGSRLCAFRHNDPAHLETLFKRYAAKGRGRMLILEGVSAWMAMWRL